MSGQESESSELSVLMKFRNFYASSSLFYQGSRVERIRQLMHFKSSDLMMTALLTRGDDLSSPETYSSGTINSPRHNRSFCYSVSRWIDHAIQMRCNAEAV
jgi:hypothetical protein